MPRKSRQHIFNWSQKRGDHVRNGDQQKRPLTTFQSNPIAVDHLEHETYLDDHSYAKSSHFFTGNDDCSVHTLEEPGSARLSCLNDENNTGDIAVQKLDESHSANQSCLINGNSASDTAVQEVSVTFFSIDSEDLPSSDDESLPSQPVQSDLPVPPLEDLLKVVQTNVSLLLPRRWVVVVKDGGVQSGLLAESEALVVQRSMFLHPDGHIKVHVHGKSLPASHKIYGLMPKVDKIALSDETVDSFGDRFLKMVDIVRSYEMCTGVEDLTNMWKYSDDVVVDNNPFLESRYSTTFRSNKCSQLVPGVAAKRCENCRLLWKRLIELKRKSVATHSLCSSPVKKPKRSDRYTGEENDVDAKQTAQSKFENGKQTLKGESTVFNKLRWC